MIEVQPNKPGDRCAAVDRFDRESGEVTFCQATAVEVLREEPFIAERHLKRFSFAFCRRHADEQAAFGLERVGASSPGQMELAA